MGESSSLGQKFSCSKGSQSGKTKKSSERVAPPGQREVVREARLRPRAD